MERGFGVEAANSASDMTTFGANVVCPLALEDALGSFFFWKEFRLTFDQTRRLTRWECLALVTGKFDFAKTRLAGPRFLLARFPNERCEVGRVDNFSLADFPPSSVREICRRPTLRREIGVLGGFLLTSLF